MELKFYKYQATGNDFILLNGFGSGLNLTLDEIRRICNRHFGVGSDGLIILRPDSEAEFFMEFYNPDGSIATFCGNGGRAAVAFAFQQGLIQSKTVFRALDGLHKAEITAQNIVNLQMTDVDKIIPTDYGLYLNTGTDHVVRFVDELNDLDIVSEARPIRYAEQFQPSGTNVNFVKIDPDSNAIAVRTYEKGVENETLSCGTGVVASALAAAFFYQKKSPITVKTRGGELKVSFEQQNSKFTNIWLSGPAQMVFWGVIKF